MPNRKGTESPDDIARDAWRGSALQRVKAALVPGMRELIGQGESPAAAEAVNLSREEYELERERIKELFDRIDTDKNGKLHAGELQVELMRLQIPITENHIREMFTRDRNKDGSLDFEEFFGYCMEKEAQARQIFDAMDQHRDNLLNMEEIKTAFERLGFKVTESEIRRLIRHISDGNDQVSWSEWRQFMLLFPATHVRDIFRHWQKSAMLGDDNLSLVPDDYDNEDLSRRWWIQLLSGGVAGAVSRTFTAPLDRLKVMLIVQQKHRGMIETFFELLREGGVRSFWRGNGVNVLKIAPESAIKFFAWEQAKRILYGNSDDASVPVGRKLAAGGFAGVVSQTAVFPMEVLKTRLASATTGKYRGIAHCATVVYRMGGFSAFYRGLTPSLLGAMPYAAIDFYVYDTLKEKYIASNPGREPSVLVLMACGATSSSVGQLASYPLALVRTRMQASDRPTGMLRELLLVYREGGLPSLYRGLIPNFIKVAPAVSITYVIYERMKALLL
eukprot:m.29998 g.29998  ORF g.29998 m.29998 type:complete len:503 (+) comp4729_c0_seq1:33-1541(+)